MYNGMRIKWRSVIVGWVVLLAYPSPETFCSYSSGNSSGVMMGSDFVQKSLYNLIKQKEQICDQIIERIVLGKANLICTITQGE